MFVLGFCGRLSKTEKYCEVKRFRAYFLLKFELHKLLLCKFIQYLRNYVLFNIYNLQNMSVTVEGVKGYEYQYKVTVLVALMSNIDKVELFVEIEGSEDALLKIKQNNIDKAIEIQVKRENNNLNISKLVDWLCHFQESKSDNNLLHRITEQKNTIALFVTNSRCSDDIVILKTNIETIQEHNNITITKKWNDDFLATLNNKSFGKTALMSKRKDFCQRQSNNFKSIADLSNILKQVLIWEEFSDDIIDEKIISMLNSNYHIAQSNTQNVYLKLLEIVKKGRDTSVNILPNIVTAIQENKIGRPVVDNNYKSRSEEQDLINFLTTENTLLLTGVSLCGKSEIAKKVAIHFFNEGYDYKITDDLEDIKRFFSTNLYDKKVAILEDPWGHTTAVVNFEERKRKIKDIINNIENHHKLIITCKIEVLLEIFDTESIENCKIKNLQWIDLTIKDNSKLNGFWSDFSKAKSLPDNIIKLISKNILDSNSHYLLQIGQLRYLLGEEVSNLVDKSYEELEHIARQNSIDIANSLKQKDPYFAEILSIIALCATPIYPINFNDLAYILSDSIDKVSFISKCAFTSSSGEKETPFPKYLECYELSQNVQKALEYLEERQLIHVVDEKISFSHPNYHEAGRYLFISKSEIKQKRILTYLEKCLSCLNPINAYLATKQFSFLYKRVQNSLQEKIIDIALECQNSIFPSVEDSSLIFLTDLIEILDTEKAKDVIRDIQRGGTSSSYIYWHNKEVPYISNKSRFIFFRHNIDNQIVTEAKNELLNKRLPNAYKVWQFILNLEDDYELQPSFFKILLQCNEAFIRKKIVVSIFNRANDKYKSIIHDIFDDEHPTVVFNAIRATLQNWFKFSQEFKKFLLDLILISLNKKQVAIRAYNLISTFHTDYGDESIYWRGLNNEQKEELWGIWGKMYPTTVENLPLSTDIHTSRFGLTMDEAMKYLNVKVGIKVLETWLKRIDNQIQNGEFLDEFELAVADNLMQLTKGDYIVRKKIFTFLLLYNDTNFLLSNLKWIIQYWNDLHLTERNQIIALIHSDRKDLRWIKAVLLNSYSPPDEIIFHILGEKQLFEKDIEYILSKFPVQLLRDSLNIFCGFPQPFWWLAFHGKNREFWSTIIRHTLMDETRIGFDICLQEFLNDGVNGFSSFREDGIVVWRKVCNCIVNKNLLIESLIYNIARCSYNISITKKMWTILIESFSVDDEENVIVRVIVENIELLQQTSHKDDLFKIFEEDFMFNKIIPAIHPDSYLINVLKIFESNPFLKDEEGIEKVYKLIELIIEKPIRFFGTFNFIKSLTNKKMIPDEIIVILQKMPSTINEIGKTRLNEIKQKFEYKLDDWIEVI